MHFLKNKQLLPRLKEQQEMLGKSIANYIHITLILGKDFKSINPLRKRMNKKSYLKCNKKLNVNNIMAWIGLPLRVLFTLIMKLKMIKRLS